MNKKLITLVILENLFFIMFFTLSVIILYVVIDFFENIDKFLKGFSLVKIFLYYFFQVPYLFVLLLPVGSLLAPFFTIGRMAREFELIAIKTSGINLRKFFIPLVITGIFLSLLSFTVNETLEPFFMRKALSIKYREIEKRPAPWERIFETNFNFIEKIDGVDRFFHFGTIDSRRREGHEIYILETFKGKTKRFIYSKSGKFTENGWELIDGVIYEYSVFSEDVINFENFNKRLFEEMRVSPIEMLSLRKSVEEMNIFEIKKLINILKNAGLDSKKEEVEFFVHFSFPFSVFITLLFSVSLSTRIRQKGKAFVLTLATVLSFIYWGLLEISRAMGYAYILSPFLSAWLPNFIFLIPAIIFFLKIEV
ncbi:MAG: LptF/LptG family permease [Candidatus Hydrothermales bacterium]